MIPKAGNKHTAEQARLRAAYFNADSSAAGVWLYEEGQHKATGRMCHTFLTVMEAETVPALKKKVAAGQPPKCTLPKRVYVSVRFKVYSKFAQMLESHTGKSHLQDWVWTSDVGLREKIYDAEYQSKGLTRLEATIKGTCLSEQGAKTLLEHFRGFVSGGLTFNSIRNQWTGFCKRLKSYCFIVDLPQ